MKSSVAKQYFLFSLASNPTRNSISDIAMVIMQTEGGATTSEYYPMSNSKQPIEIG